MPIRYAAFDMAGTTVEDTGGIVRHFFKEAFDEVLPSDIVRVSDEEIDAVMGWDKMTAIQKVLTTRYKDEIPPVGLAQRIFDYFEAACLQYYQHPNNTKEIPGAEDSIRSLQAAGIEVGLDTGFTRPITETIVKTLEWEDLVDQVISSQDVEKGRPAPDMILKAIKDSPLADLKPSEVAKIGDTVSDLMSGINAKCGLVIGVLSGTGTREQFQQIIEEHRGNASLILIAKDVNEAARKILAYNMAETTTPAEKVYGALVR